jgi:hypothetical protein
MTSANLSVLSILYLFELMELHATKQALIYIHNNNTTLCQLLIIDDKTYCIFFKHNVSKTATFYVLIY